MSDREPPAPVAYPIGAFGPAANGGWKAMRDRLRDIIRAEVAKLDPTEDARHPLELIVETSVRHTEVDGEARITVVDEAGRPRTAVRDGQTVPFTLQDLLEELRLDHPILFNAPPETNNLSEAHGPTPANEGGKNAGPQRDWLDLGSGAGAKAPRPPLSRRGLNPLRRIGAVVGPAKPRPPKDLLPTRPETAPDVFEDGSGHALLGRPGVALGTVALVAILAAGALVLPEIEPRPSRHIEGPAVTGTVPPPSPPVQSVTPPEASQPEPRTLRGVPEVLDTATLSLEGEVVRLFGVEWAPGAGKPDDLTRYLQGREITCTPVGANDTYRCQVGGQDLSKVVLFNGGGRATAEATPELKVAAEKARAAQIGVWSK